MFKCSECGTKYKTKPAYCRCGNDIFEEIITRSMNNTVSIKDDLLYYAIFFVCILLSLIVLFAGTGKNKFKEETINSKPTISVEKLIPDINEYWDNSTPMPQQSIKITSPIKENNNEIIEQNRIITTKNVMSAAQIKNTADKEKFTKNKSTQKQQTTQKNTANSVKSQQTSTDYSALTSRIKNNINYTQNSAKTNVGTSQLQKKATSLAPAVSIPDKTSRNNSNSLTTGNNTILKNTQNQITVTTKSQAQLTQELNLYKNLLRNTLARKIDFTKVIGDGDCTLSFKIDTSGKLLNKKFVTQSSNLTLNEQAYKALNSTSSYNPPPEGYHSEVLVLNIHFYSGNFEVSLK